MQTILVFKEYLVWHYGTGMYDLLRLWRNFIWFVPHAFSFSALFRTLFSPWKRLGETYRKGFDPEGFFEALLVNTIMRFIGFLMRVVLLVLGLISLFSVLFGGIVLLIFWSFAPLIFALLLIIGVRFILM